MDNYFDEMLFFLENFPLSLALVHELWRNNEIYGLLLAIYGELWLFYHTYSIYRDDMIVYAVVMEILWTENLSSCGQQIINFQEK